MSSTTLRDFVLNAVEMKRIRFADLRRLQRDILPYRITTAEEAEMLLSLDAVVERADRDWREYLVPAVAQFAVWGLEPTGRVDQAKADWLLDAVALAPPKTGSAIIRHVVIEAPSIDDNVALRPKPVRELPPPPTRSEVVVGRMP
jgi:hypothetical protein